MEDKAGHSVSNSMDFVINRQGSKVSHNSYLDELLSEEGKYVRALKDDIVITEINPSGVIGGSQFAITEDGKPMALDDVMTTSSDEINGWKRYIYRIKKEAFNRDGIIKIAFSSTDVGGNFLDEKKAGLSDMGFIAVSYTHLTLPTKA